ncbi:MAG: hypothetical protein LBV67_10585 [Streptococcaceae bacterium]|nr:hypothetical protein [Streptococcaceae bacterium]
MKRRSDNLRAFGIKSEFIKYPNLGHGFGLGIGTSAQCWYIQAIKFWEEQINHQYEFDLSKK